MNSTRNFSTQRKSAQPKKGRVFVAMSGGVDSSVSAYLLKKASYDVTGVFMKVWSPDWMPCPWREERRDAMRVAAMLDIPFQTFDLEDEYKRGVVDYMIAEYKTGRTPNPDVMCNREVKFGAFLKWAMKQGADYIATGHYARVIQNVKIKNQSSNLRTTNYVLRTGNDPNKDQSYFLWTLTQNVLAKTLFPVGDLTKPEVRKIAARAGLPVAEKKDSQGICFLGPVDMKEFLKHYIKTKPGDVLDEHGKVIGRHDGAELYTIGEHHIGYVVAKDLEENTLTVSPRSPATGSRSSPGDLVATSLILRDTNWLIDPALLQTPNSKPRARVRYRQPLQSCVLVKDEGLRIKDTGWRVVFDEPQTVAPGQSVVIYKNEIVVGGGIIQ